MTATDDTVRWAAPLLFRIADKFFKFASWAILLVAIRYAQKLMSSAPFTVVSYAATWIWAAALLAQAFYIALRDPSTLNVRPEWHRISRIVQIPVGFAFVWVLVAPALYLDQLLAALEQVRLK